MKFNLQIWKIKFLNNQISFKNKNFKLNNMKNKWKI